jgi:hypothetical protein
MQEPSAEKARGHRLMTRVWHFLRDPVRVGALMMFLLMAVCGLAFLQDINVAVETHDDMKGRLKGKMQSKSSMLKPDMIYDHYTPMIDEEARQFEGQNTVEIIKIGHDPDYGDSFSITAFVQQERNTKGYILSKSVALDTDERCFGLFMSSFATSLTEKLKIKLSFTYGSEGGKNAQAESPQLTTDIHNPTGMWVAASVNGTHVRFYLNMKQLGGAIELNKPLLVCPGGWMFAGMRAPDSEFFTGRYGRAIIPCSNQQAVPSYRALINRPCHHTVL